MSFSTTIFEVLLPQQTLATGSTTASLGNLSNEVPSVYKVMSEVSEVADSIVTTTLFSRTAEGEVPQQMGIIETQGGGELAERNIPPGIEVSASTVVSGADTPVSLLGTSDV